MSYEWLPEETADHLREWGLNVREHLGWQGRAKYGPQERHYTPRGIINHHTAGTNWYPPTRLYESCQLYIDPAGVVHVIAAGYNPSSGMGDPKVLNAILRSEPVPPPQDRNAVDRIDGNSWFVNIEVGHWGLGQPIPAAQRDALIGLNAALCELLGFDVEDIIGHLEWTLRKIDPNWEWDGARDTMDAIRADTESRRLEGVEPDMKPWKPGVEDPTYEPFKWELFELHGHKLTSGNSTLLLSQCSRLTNSARTPLSRISSWCKS